MSKPSFSICIPNYNYADYIGKTIQSVLDQEYSHFEIVIVDNASTDGSLEVIKSFRDTRIRVYQNEYNVGFAPNLQVATQFAQMDYINLLSSDDLMKPGALAAMAEQIEAMGNPDDLLLFSDVDLIDGEGTFVGYDTRKRDFSSKKIMGGSQVVDDVENHGELVQYEGLTILKDSLKNLKSFAPFASTVYSKRLWERVGGYNAVRTIGPDKYFGYKVLELNPKVLYFRKSLFQYRVHQTLNSKAQRNNVKQQIDDYLYTIEYSDARLEPIGIKNKDLVRSFINRVCLKTGLTELVHGTYKHAWRMLGLAIGTYPTYAIKRKRFYFLLGLLMLGPLAKPVAKLFYAIFAKK